MGVVGGCGLCPPNPAVSFSSFSPYRCETLPHDLSKCNELNGRRNFYAFPTILNIDFSINNAIIDGVRVSLEMSNAPQECINALEYIMCLVGAPPCNQDTCLPVKICNDSCAAFKRLQTENLCDQVEKRLRELRSSSPLSSVRLLVDTYGSREGQFLAILGSETKFRTEEPSAVKIPN